MTKKEITDEGASPEEVASKVELDAPHKAYREIIENYKIKNPVKYEAKKALLEARFLKRLAFGVAPDGSLLDGRVDPQNGKRVPIEIVEVN